MDSYYESDSGFSPGSQYEVIYDENDSERNNSKTENEDINDYVICENCRLCQSNDLIGEFGYFY